MCLNLSMQILSCIKFQQQKQQLLLQVQKNGKTDNIMQSIKELYKQKIL